MFTRVYSKSCEILSFRRGSAIYTAGVFQVLAHGYIREPFSQTRTQNDDCISPFIEQDRSFAFQGFIVCLALMTI